MNDAILDLVEQQVRLKIDNDMYKNGVIRLGAFIAALKKCKPEADVRFDFNAIRPGTFDSYRGYYDHLALSIGDQTTNVASVLADAEKALGATFHGYKGGEYVMTKDTPLWVGDYGNCTDTAITGVLDKDWRVIIQTAFVD